MANKTARQKKLGPAPFASFEDSFDDLSSPESKGYQPMPEICEERYQQTDNNNDVSASTSTAQTPTTPRIDVEQASSPSQGESGDSTPERELFGLDMAADNVTSAFLEGAADVDLRSSAEGMGIPYSADSIKGRHSRNSSLLATGKSAPVGRRDAAGQQPSVAEAHHPCNTLERRGSMGRNSSNNHTTDPFVFPCRETRLSSISSNVSATSGMSFLSAFSGRRSPSPHRMQLETSFCGPKTLAAAAAKEAEEDEELLEFEASRRPSLLNPNSWLGDGSSRCASPIGTPSSPGCMRAFMFKYATEPRSRPTSPMGWNSSAPSPGASLNPNSEFAGTSSRWLASPRCQRRSSSPHRTLVETSFCGHMQMKVPDDEVAPRGPSPMPSLGSLLSIQSHPVKYATEPRSRPASPTANRSVLNLMPVPTGSRRGSQSLPGGRCSSPMIETSFCGPKHLARRDSKEDAPSPAPSNRAPSSLSTRPSEAGGQDGAVGLRPIKYATEPRSRPASPVPCVHQPIVTAASISRSESPILINRTARSPSPHRTRVETSFCGAKSQQVRQDSVAGAQPNYLPADNNVTEVSIHPLPVKYATEPRSRPVSPCGMFSHNCPTPDRDRRPMRSPSPMIVETSFCGSKLAVEDDDDGTPLRPAIHQKDLNVGEPPSQPSTMSVKYTTEPRSRPTSPGMRLLSDHSTPVPDRRNRSPSPHRMLVETSFCGAKQMPRQESQVLEAIQLVEAALQRRKNDEEDELSNSSCSVNELPVARNHFEEKPSNSSSSSMMGATEEKQAVDFPTHWPDQVVSEFEATWPAVHHLSTFELSPEKKSRSSSEDTASPPSQHSNGHIASMSGKVSTAPASPNPVRPGRHMPKPVACPKPPQSFVPQSDSSAQSSPLASPALSRRFESASPSPSSPFPSRRTSLGSTLRSNQVAEEAQAPSDQPVRDFSAKAAKGGDSSDDSPYHSQPERTDRKDGHKGRSVLSVLFGKRSGKSKLKDQDLEAVDEKSMAASRQNGQQQESASRMLSLPLPSRDSSPGRSLGDSGDDLDEGDGFQHQVLDAGNESGDNLVESEEAIPGSATNPPRKEEISFFHQDSIEEELPFVPTTLPIERPIAPVITPVRMRISELKTTPIQRPRCSVSFGPSSINDYVKIARADSVAGEDPSAALAIPKIKVSLPKPEREESVDDLASAVPAVKVTVGSVCSNWEAFSEQVFVSRKRFQPGTSVDAPDQDGIKASPAARQQQPPPKSSQWINVEEIPEPVKEAKAIKVVSVKNQANKSTPAVGADEAAVKAVDDRTPEEEDPDKMNLVLPVRKDSVSSETALLREIEETEMEEDRSPPPDDDETSVAIRQRISQSSSLAELDNNLDDMEAAVLAQSNLLSVAPFGMDLDVHSNRSSVVAPSEEIPSSSPEEESSISTE